MGGYNKHGEATEQVSAMDHGMESLESILKKNVVDAFGCLPYAGYTWCERLTKCLKLFEEACEEEKPMLFEDTEMKNDSLDSSLSPTLQPGDNIPNQEVEEEEEEEKEEDKEGEEKKKKKKGRKKKKKKKKKK